MIKQDFVLGTAAKTTCLVSMVVERLNEYGKPCWVATLDFKKAFDTISQDSIWNALEEQGVSHKYISILQRLYEGQHATVKTDHRSRIFGIFRGTKQGDPISPILFNSVVEGFMRRLKERWAAKRWGIQLGHSNQSILTNLRFADDVLIFGRSISQVTKMLTQLNKAANDHGLELHPEKTK